MSKKRATRWELMREKRKRKREHMGDVEKAMERLRIATIILVIICLLFVIIFPNGVPWADPYAPKPATTTSSV